MFKPIFKAYSTSLLGIISGLLSQLVYIRELVHIVPSDEFALYAFVFQIVTYMSILQLGLDFAISREIAVRLGQNDRKGAYQSFSFIRGFNYKVCIAGTLIVLTCAVLFYNGIGISSKFNMVMAAKLVILFGLSMFLSLLSNPNIVALIGSNLQSKVNVNNILITIVTNIVAYILLKATSLGLYAMPLALIFFNAINIFILRSKAYRYCKEWLVKDDTEVITKGYNKSVLKFSVMSTIGGVAWTIESTSDIFILNGTGSMALVGFYVLWWRFPHMFFDLATRLTSSALPSLNASFGKSEQDSKLIFNRLLLIVGCIGFCLYLGVANLLPAFINLWVGPQFFIDDLHITSFFIGMLIYSRTIGNCFGMYTITIGKVSYSTALSWVHAFVKVITAIILVKQMGMKGLFIASIAGSFIQVCGCGILLLKRKLLRTDVMLLLILGYLAPVTVLFFRISERLPVLIFLYGAIVTLVCAVITWVIFIEIISLNKKLGFSLSPRVFFNKIKKSKLTV
jgi:O-antigen/teichoic acid export membrane protein